MSDLALMSSSRWPLLFVSSLAIVYTIRKVLSAKPRTSQILPAEERVLILGASSGIGRDISHLYAKRGARVLIVGRREAQLDNVLKECRNFAANSSKITSLAADFTNVDNMLAVRDKIEKEWKGVDTMVVAAGVSALQPLMAVAGVQSTGRNSFEPRNASRDGILQAVQITAAATAGNYVGPLVAALTFIPLLIQTSTSPSIMLISSLAAIAPAPTRTLYASTKAASLVLYQALSIEHPAITFSMIIPSTVQGDFRASAVDSGPIREKNPNVHGLNVADVAMRSILAVDRKEKTVFLPKTMKVAPLLYWLWPTFVEGRARVKYNFTP